jgi:sugar phosphate isomerase/epimerase
MYKAFDAGSLGINTDLEGAIALAAKYGYQGLTVDMNAVAERGASRVGDLLAEAHLLPAAFGLAADYRKGEDAFIEGLSVVATHAALAEQIGCTRCVTWVLSFSDELPPRENFKRHADRLGRCAALLADHGCSLGLEFLGPATMRASHEHEFIHTAAGMIELCDALGTGNAGLLLDAWHWYTSHGTVADLEALRAEQVVFVHVNDAPAGMAVDEQKDSVRAMPCETGVIDIAGFMKSLATIRYDGPVQVEPFSERIRALPAEEAARLTAETLDEVLRLT